MQSLKIRANAKINFTLGITGKREDGYHYIDSIMQSVSLFDTVKITASDDIKVLCSDESLSSEKNIAFKAAKLFFENTGLGGGALIDIEKRIPCTAGLGGGSADAAATLYGLNRIYGTNLSDEKLCDIAIKLGADVPFFIRGGTQRVRGIGDSSEILPDLKNCFFILVKCGDKLSTGDMYKKLDAAEFDVPDNDAAVEALCREDNKALSKYALNSFSSVVDIDDMKSVLGYSEPLCVSLSGSGPTVFAMYDSLKKAAFAEAILKAENIDYHFVRPVSRALKI